MGLLPDTRKEPFNLVDTKDVLRLTLPRYNPLVLKGTALAVWHDSHEGKYLVLCPRCRGLVTYETFDSVYREMVLSERKCCQSCRAGISFEHAPDLIGIFLDFWSRTGNFPESASWLEAVAQKQFNLWAKKPLQPGEKILSND
jgi:hypothetical protein